MDPQLLWIRSSRDGDHRRIVSINNSPSSIFDPWTIKSSSLTILRGTPGKISNSVYACIKLYAFGALKSGRLPVMKRLDEKYYWYAFGIRLAQNSRVADFPSHNLRPSTTCFSSDCEWFYDIMLTLNCAGSWSEKERGFGAISFGILFCATLFTEGGFSFCLGFARLGLAWICGYGCCWVGFSTGPSPYDTFLEEYHAVFPLTRTLEWNFKFQLAAWLDGIVYYSFLQCSEEGVGSCWFLAHASTVNVVQGLGRYFLPAGSATWILIAHGYSICAMVAHVPFVRWECVPHSHFQVPQGGFYYLVPIRGRRIIAAVASVCTTGALEYEAYVNFQREYSDIFGLEQGLRWSDYDGLVLWLDAMVWDNGGI
ncbi:hypothetical protein RHGRI_020272 [Rhododendron griersonianum]|uniref:Uncharacterized protein n=1 Tax=Rhododendron griersonianum TaxID=479676 RepID=A0AAV6JKR0_9ERIC|nr:hypothetical protein RHGRI_020272 [Rhododendron griersonianum]